MTHPLNVTVLGGGSFGTAIAKVLSEGQQHITLWMRDEEQARYIRE
ncbi:MAG: glycerol-3-phosphate dehydrogenase, partial [Halomonadaceae bacterium]